MSNRQHLGFINANGQDFDYFDSENDAIESGKADLIEDRDVNEVRIYKLVKQLTRAEQPIKIDIRDFPCL